MNPDTLEKLAKLTGLAAKKTANERALVPAGVPKTAPWCGDEAPKTALGEQASHLSAEKSAPTKGLESTIQSAPRTALAPPSPQNGGGTADQGAVLGGVSPTKEALPLKTGGADPAVIAYLCGSRLVDATALEIVEKQYPRDPYYLKRTCDWLAPQLVKAQGWLDGQIPNFDDGVPSPTVQAKIWRLNFKAKAMDWHWRILDDYLNSGSKYHTTGFRGMRLYTFKDEALECAWVRDVRLSMRQGAPFNIYANIIVQWPESDYAVLTRPLV